MANNLLHPPEIRRRNQYSRWLLYDALKCVLRGKMNCHQAAIRFKVPRSTIQRKLNLCRQQHRLALELGLQRNLPTSSGYHRTYEQHSSYDDEGFHSNDVNASQIVTPTSSCNSWTNEQQHFEQEHSSSSLYTDAFHYRRPIKAARNTYVETPISDSVDQFREDEIDFCGEEHIVGDEISESPPTNGVDIIISSDGSIESGQPLNHSSSTSLYNDSAAIVYNEEPTLVTVEPEELPHSAAIVASSSTSDEYTYAYDATYVNSTPEQQMIEQRIVGEEYWNVDGSRHLLNEKPRLRYIEQQANSEDDELERAADRLSEAFRSVPSKSKLPRYLNNTQPQYVYLYHDNVPVQQQQQQQHLPQDHIVVMSEEFSSMQRHHPHPVEYVYIDDPQDVHENIVIDEAD